MVARSRVAAVFLLAAVPGRSFAEDAVEAIQVEVLPSACADLPKFWDQIRARTDRVREARPRETTRVFSVWAAPGSAGAKGRLVITELSGGRTVRELDAETCEEVVAGLALIAAIAIDPDARTEPLSPATRPQGPPQVPATIAPPADSFAPPPRVDAAEAGRALVLQGFGRVMQDSPAFMGAAGGIEWDPNPERVMSPVVRLGGFFAQALEPVTTGSGSARFRWVGGRVQVCPLRFPRERSGHLDLCAHFEVGALSGQGFDTESATGASRLWTAPGALARAAIDLGGGIFLEAEISGEIALGRPAFLFRPDTLALQVAPVVASAAAGVGAGF